MLKLSANTNIKWKLFKIAEFLQRFCCFFLKVQVFIKTLRFLKTFFPWGVFNKFTEFSVTKNKNLLFFLHVCWFEKCSESGLYKNPLKVDSETRVKGIRKGFFKGIGSLYKKPLKGNWRTGVKGIRKGFFKGIGSLYKKPLKGNWRTGVKGIRKLYTLI